MNDVLQKSEAFAVEQARKVPLRFTETELKVLCAHLALAYSQGYRDASVDCAEIVKQSVTRPPTPAVTDQS